jgi:hypothetical protein
LLYFPYVVLHTTVVGTIKVFGFEGIKGWVPYNSLLLILFALNVRTLSTPHTPLLRLVSASAWSLMWGVWCMQIFWFYQIVRIGYLSLRNGTQTMDDIREKARNSPPAPTKHQQQLLKDLPPLASTSKRAARGKAKAAA